MNKQIEEMTIILDQTDRENADNMVRDMYEDYATAIYDAGYRKVENKDWYCPKEELLATMESLHKANDNCTELMAENEQLKKELVIAKKHDNEVRLKELNNGTTEKTI